MIGPWRHARTVVEEHAVSVAIDDAAKRYARFSDAYEALTWLLSRRCDKISMTSRPVVDVRYCLYRQAADPMANTPDIVVLYTYTENEVILIDIRIEEPEIESE